MYSVKAMVPPVWCSIAMMPHTAFAGKPVNTAAEIPVSQLCENSDFNCALDVQGSAGEAATLTWPEFDSVSADFSVFGYDLYYGNPGLPGSNANRIETGARSPLTDNLDSYATRCDLSQYHVRAYSKARKSYSEALRSSSVANFCGGGGGGGGSADDNEVSLAQIDFSSVPAPLCDANDTLQFDRDSYLAANGYDSNAVFVEEFDSLTDTSDRWDSAHAWGPDTIINNEAQYYIDAFNVHSDYGWSPFEIINDGSGNNYLVIKAKQASDVDIDTNLTSGQDYVSGVLSTRGLNDFTYGYFESRLRVAPGNGTWSAFWLNHTSFRRNKPEIDIVEYLGQSYDAGGDAILQSGKSYTTYETQYHTYWYGKRRKRTELHYTNSKCAETPEWCGTNTIAGDSIPDAPIDFSAGFHTYGVLWEPGRIVWFIDGVEVFRVPNAADNLAIANEDMYLVLNIAIGNDNGTFSWPGAPDSDTTDLMDTGEVNMVVDYVKVYKHPGF